MTTVRVDNLTSSEYVKHHLQHWQYNIGNSKFWVVNLDTILVSFILGFFSLALIYLCSRRATSSVPNCIQNGIELLFEWVDNSVSDIYHRKRDFVTPLAITIFVWILLMNCMDLIPVDLVGWVGSFFYGNHISFKLVPTADPNLTFALSFSVFLLILIYNVKGKGFFGLIKEIVSSPFGIWLFPLNIIFRIIDEVVKPLSLSLRLYGNLFAGELIFVLIALLPWWISWVFGSLWAVFHVLVIVIQAFVFMMLTVVYLNLAQDKH